MPVNKNAMTRYKILDDLLSNRYHNYSLDDLTRGVNEALNELGVDSVSRRCVEKDINYIEFEGPFLAEIERYSAAGFKTDTQKSYTKRCLKYADPAFSIFKKSMSDDERHLLSEALSMIGQFDGLPNLDSLENLRLSMGINTSDNRAISFTKNPLENSSLLGQLFTAITNKQVLEIEYQPYNAECSKTIRLHPYLLKEYNRRWYLYAAADVDDKLLHFNLDIIGNVKFLPSHPYRMCAEDINEYFDDIVGVTLHKDARLEKILFWVSDRSKHYVDYKPIHDSQVRYKSAKEQSLKAEYPMLEGGFFFSVECRENYELIRELCSFGSELLVLSPRNIHDAVFERINRMVTNYNSLRR
ncbi:MAG: WYL domain-containing protein [Bacteroidales bacterium]